jgi:hypothetical protein
MAISLGEHVVSPQLKLDWLQPQVKLKLGRGSGTRRGAERSPLSRSPGSPTLNLALGSSDAISLT